MHFESIFDFHQCPDIWLPHQDIVDLLTAKNIIFHTIVK